MKIDKKENSMEWKYIKQLSDVKNIEKFENIIGRTLPEEYTNFIKKYNGGRPALKLFKNILGTEHVIKSFLSFNEEDKENIFSVYEWLDKKLPNNHFAIAIDPAGNFICYNENFEICFWNHETSNSTKIANSLESFIKSLYE